MILSMGYKEFDRYIADLSAGQKTELFHIIYNAYLYVGTAINQKGVSSTDFFKCMAKIKRYEVYIHKILTS